MTTRADQLRDALAALHPVHLDIEDESHMHSRGLETHYKVVIASAAFEGLRAIQRHRTVHTALGAQMQQIHALALHPFTPDEWAAEVRIPDSPHCRGGSRHDKPAG